MRLTTLTVLTAALAAQAAAADPVGDHLMAAAETCIRSGAPKVAAQTQGLSDAVSFLIDDLCAPDIRHLEAYDRNSRLLAVIHADLPKPKAASAAGSGDQAAPASGPAGAMKSLGMLQAILIDPDTGDLTVPAGAKPSLSAPLMFANWFSGGYASSAAHARLRSIAAQAVLAARETAPRR